MPAATSRIHCDVDFGRAGKQAGYLRVPNSVNDSAYGTVLIPIWTIGEGRGPTILFTGGVHGDEYEGPVALSKVARQLQADAVRGTVILIPCVNTPAMQAGTRLSPLDNLNLNRVFPGDRDGSVSMMIAHFVDALLLPRVDYQVDLHSGGKTLEFLPLVTMKECRDKGREARTREAALAFGAPYALLNRDLDETGLLESAVEARGILHLASELGGAGRVTRAHVEIAEFGILNLLRHFGFLAEPPIDPASVGSASRLIEVEDMGSYVIATATGVLEPLVELGEPVEAGQAVARIHFPDDVDRDPVTLTSARTGLLICRRPLGEVRRGDNAAIIGRPLA